MVLTLKNLPLSYANFIGTLHITSINRDLTFKQLSTKFLQQDRWKNSLGVQLQQNLRSREANWDKRMMEINLLSWVNTEKLLNAFIVAIMMKTLERSMWLWLRTRSRKSSAFMARNKDSKSGKDDWYIYSGASRHSTSNIDWYANFLRMNCNLIHCVQRQRRI